MWQCNFLAPLDCILLLHHFIFSKYCYQSIVCINNIFSIVPKSRPAIMLGFELSSSATLNMNFGIPTVVFPANVVPSKNSVLALWFKKSIYFQIVEMPHFLPFKPPPNCLFILSNIGLTAETFKFKVLSFSLSSFCNVSKHFLLASCTLVNPSSIFE